MKNIVLTIAFLAGFGFAAQAQSKPATTAKKATVSVSQKKATTPKQAVELKSTSVNNASAPLLLPLPKQEADTSAVPVVKTGSDRQ